MTQIERQMIDAQLLSLKEDLIPIDLTYEGHDFQRYTSNQALSSFTAGQYLEILCNKDSGSAIDFSESYFVLDLIVGLSTTNPPNPAVVDTPIKPLQSTFTFPESFLHSLFDDLRVTIASTDINAFMAGPQLYQQTAILLEVLDSKERMSGASRIAWDPPFPSVLVSQVDYETFLDNPDPYRLSVPCGLVNCDIWNLNSPYLIGYTAGQLGTTVGTTAGFPNISNPNAVYLHMIATASRVSFPVYGATQTSVYPNRFKLTYKSKMPVMCMKHKFMHASDIQFRLRRSGTAYWQGAPAVDADVPATFAIQFTNLELFLSKYRCTQKIIQEINQIKVNEDIMYKCRKINTYNFLIPYSQMNGSFQQTVNPGALADVVFVYFIRQEALTQPTPFTAPPQMVGAQIYSMMACAPRPVCLFGAQTGAPSTWMPAGAPGVGYSALVSPYISALNIYYQGIQSPSTIYHPDDGGPSANGVSATADREYDVFVHEMKMAGYGDCLTTITKTVWNSFYRVFCFNCTRNYAPNYAVGTELTNRSTIQINVTFASQPSLAGLNVNQNPNYQMMVICINNQAILKVNQDSSVVFIE